MADEKHEHETRERQAREAQERQARQGRERQASHEQTGEVRDRDREQVARERFDKAREKRAEQDEKFKEREKWKPTPTQEENDLVAMGLPVDKVGHEPDGSKEYPTRTMHPAQSDDRKKGYETR